MKYTILAVAALALVAQGCVTATPAFGGKTRAETTFVDADGTSYTRNVELPAGVDLAGQDGMTYQWGADGSGNIAINQQGNANSTVQADLQGKGLEAQTQLTQSLASLVGAVAELAAPLIGLNLTNNAALDQTNAANQYQLKQQWMTQAEKLMQDQGVRDWILELLTRPTTATGATEASP